MTTTATVSDKGAEPLTFFHLPPEIRNYIYELSGCLCIYEGTKWTERCYANPRESYIAFGDFVPCYTCRDKHHLDGCYSYEWVKHGRVYLVINRGHHKAIRRLEPYRLGNRNGFERGLRKPIKWWRDELDTGCRRVVTRTICTPDLTLASRRVREETIPMFSGNHPFVFVLFEPEDEESLVVWLEKIGTNAAASIWELILVYKRSRYIKHLEGELIWELRKRGIKPNSVRCIRPRHPFLYGHYPRYMQERETFLLVRTVKECLEA